MKELKCSVSAADMNMDDYDAVFLPGKLTWPADTLNSYAAYEQTCSQCWLALIQTP